MMMTAYSTTNNKRRRRSSNAVPGRLTNMNMLLLLVVAISFTPTMAFAPTAHQRQHPSAFSSQTKSIQPMTTTRTTTTHERRSSRNMLMTPDGGDALGNAAAAIADFSLLTSAADAAIDADSRLSDSTIVAIFVAGVFPFAVATVEFWRRIAVGASFGTGSDSVVFDVTIGEDDKPLSSRGRQILGPGALALALVLFALAAGVIGLAVYSVVTTGAPAELPVTTSNL